MFTDGAEEKIHTSLSAARTSTHIYSGGRPQAPVHPCWDQRHWSRLTPRGPLQTAFISLRQSATHTHTHSRAPGKTERAVHTLPHQKTPKLAFEQCFGDFPLLNQGAGKVPPIIVKKRDESGKCNKSEIIGALWPEINSCTSARPPHTSALHLDTFTWSSSTGATRATHTHTHTPGAKQMRHTP